MTQESWAQLISAAGFVFVRLLIGARDRDGHVMGSALWKARFCVGGGSRRNREQGLAIHSCPEVYSSVCTEAYRATWGAAAGQTWLKTEPHHESLCHQLGWLRALHLRGPGPAITSAFL